MKYLLAVILVIAFCTPAFCEVFMYQDDAGKWHGVSSPDKIPEAYRNSAESIKSESPSKKESPKKEEEKPNLATPDGLIDALKQVDLAKIEDLWQVKFWIEKIDEMLGYLKNDTRYSIEQKINMKIYFDNARIILSIRNDQLIRRGY